MNLTIAACLAPTALAQHAGFYDHDRSWTHGQQTATGLVPDDYLQYIGNDGPVTNSTPPFGYATRANGGGMPNQKYGGVQQGGYYVNRSGKRLARGSGCPSHSALYLNGMGGIDPAMIDDTLPSGYTPPYGGGQAQMASSPQNYGEQNFSSAAPTQPRRYSTGSKPRRVYYNSGGVISGGKVIAPGYSTWYTTRH